MRPTGVCRVRAIELGSFWAYHEGYRAVDEGCERCVREWFTFFVCKQRHVSAVAAVARSNAASSCDCSRMTPFLAAACLMTSVTNVRSFSLSVPHTGLTRSTLQTVENSLHSPLLT